MRRAAIFAAVLLMAGMVALPAMAPGLAFTQDAQACNLWNCLHCAYHDVDPEHDDCGKGSPCPHDVGPICIY